MMQTQSSTPSPSQEASAAMHLDRQNEWVWFRVNGERYVAVPSGRSGHTYWVRATADGCSCLFYERAGRQCSHMLAVERHAMLEELAEAPTLASYRDLYPGCIAGCGELVERQNQRCYRCSSDAAYRERLAGKMAGVR